MVSYRFDRELSVSQGDWDKWCNEEHLEAKEESILELPENKKIIKELEDRFKLESNYASNLLRAVCQGSYVNETLGNLISTKEKLKIQNAEVVDLAQKYKFITGKRNEDFESYSLLQGLIFSELDEEMDRNILGGEK